MHLHGCKLQAANASARLQAPGPYNPAAALPPKVVKKILAMELVEMSELRADVWPEEPALAPLRQATYHQRQDVVGMLRLSGSSAGVPFSGKRARIMGLPYSTAARGQHESRMAVISGGKLWPRRTSTVPSLTHVCTTRHSPR